VPVQTGPRLSFNHYIPSGARITHPTWSWRPCQQFLVGLGRAPAPRYSRPYHAPPTDGGRKTALGKSSNDKAFPPPSAPAGLRLQIAFCRFCRARAASPGGSFHIAGIGRSLRNGTCNGAERIPLSGIWGTPK